jgi:AcrR family transcriptional regulator
MSSPPSRTETSATRLMRADAVRSRQRLLAAAAAAFAELGTEVSVAEIAARAGVGKATVFRNFATKDELLAAIVGELIGGLVEAGERLKDAADPGDALLEFMSTGVALLARDRSFCEVIGRPTLQQPAVRAEIERLSEVTETLVDRARHHDAIRPEITGLDVVLLLGGVHQTAAPLLDTAPDLWQRYLALVFDGMRARGAGQLPEPEPPRFDVPATVEPT